MSRSSLTVAALLALGIAVVAIAQPQPAARPADPALAPVPADAFFFASAKVSKLWDNPAAKPLRDWMMSQKGGTFDAILGLPPADIDRLTLFAATADPYAGGAPVLLATTRKPYTEAAVLKALGVEKPAATTREVSINGVFRKLIFLDDRTVLYLPRDLDDRSIAPNLLGRLSAPRPDGPLASALAAAAGHDLAIGLDVRGLAAVADESLWKADKQLAPFLGLLKAKTATLTADFDKATKVRLTLSFPDADAAKQAVPLVEAAVKAFLEHLDRESKEFSRAEQAFANWGRNILKAAKVTADGLEVVATAETPFADELTKLVAALPKKLGVFRDERVAINNLKQIGIAHHAYHDANNRCASDVMQMGDKALAWSWRVQLLPYLEQDNLYKQLDFTKPWDDPANLKLLESFEMPKVFELPGREAPKGHTYFRICMLPKGAKENEHRPWLVEGERGPSLPQIPDGTSNTVMVIEAGEAVPWYKPDVLAYDGKLPLPPLGDKDADRILILLGDGSVRAIRLSKISEQVMRAVITTQGGEVIALPQ